MNAKQFLKTQAAGIMLWAGPFSSNFWRRWMLRRLKIGYDPASRLPYYRNGARAACVISLDFDHLTKSPESTDERWIPLASEERRAQNKIGTREFLSLSEKYDFPFTWAICGRTAEADYSTYESVLKSSVKQEIGVHTYGHIDVSATSKEKFEEDMERCLNIMNLNYHPSTFIFPWNRQGNFDSLIGMGYNSFRGQQRAIGKPRSYGGMLNIPPVYYFYQKTADSAKLICKYIDICVASGGVFHLWSHPWSIVENTNAHEISEKGLSPVLRYLKKLNDSGDLAIETMSSLANFICAKKE